MEKLDILFLGRLFPPKEETILRKKARVDMQDAAIVLQWNMINGLIKNGVDHIHVLSLLPVDSWPHHYKDAFVSHSLEKVNEHCTFETAGFCNVTMIKQVLVAHACDKAARRWAKKNPDRKKIILCYSENNTLMRAVVAAKKANPKILAVQTIADITEFASNASNNLIQRAYIKRQIKENIKNRSYIDRFVLLTKQMATKLNITDPYIVMEGIAPLPPNDVVCSKEKNKKIVLYTGSMNKKYGILVLLEAFQKAGNEDYRLILCGLGNAEDVIRECVQSDPRITFLGKVPHAEVLKLQQMATVVINPRQNNEEFTKYSFPSKTMEYLASGTPLIAYKLDGIPDEYDEHINYVPDNSPESLAHMITDICEMPEDLRKEKAERAKKFVLKEKNHIAQTKRILDFIKKF